MLLITLETRSSEESIWKFHMYFSSIGTVFANIISLKLASVNLSIAGQDKTGCVANK